jgi:hypothetical protein
MSATKKIILAIAIFMLVGLILIIYFYNKNSVVAPATSQPPITTVNQFPVIHGEKPPASENNFEIKTQKGDVPVENLYNLPDAKPLSEDGVNFKNSQYYYMAYYPKQQGFIIAIIDPDIENARSVAENDFLSILGINKDAACKLNVSMTVSPDASQKASGGNYRLSFCPDGKPFPN